MAGSGNIARSSIIVALLLCSAQLRSAAEQEPIVTSADLFARCASEDAGRQLCYAYIRGFSDGNRWLLKDAPVVVGVPTPQAMCVPNAEPIQVAADLFVARFRGRTQELEKLSPFRALSMALAGRYPCQ